MKAVWSSNHANGGDVLVLLSDGKIVAAVIRRYCSPGWIAEAEGAYFVTREAARRAAVLNLPSTYEGLEITTP